MVDAEGVGEKDAVRVGVGDGDNDTEPEGVAE
jgi:hypothetical protein